jgi:tetratricopeptide (TPR) repeat protein
LAHFHLGHYEQALADIARAIEIRPDDFGNVTWALPDLVASCPDEKFRAGMLALAGKVIERTRGKAGGYVYRSQLYAALKQYDKASADVEKAVEIGASDARELAAVAWYLATSSEATLRDPKRAVALAKKAVELKPKDWNVWNTLGVAHHRAGDFKAAVVALEKSSELAEGVGSKVRAAPLNNLAWLLPKRAVALATKAVELTPTAGNNWNTLGVAHYRAGDWKAAVTALEKAMKLREGGDAFDWFFLAMAHWQLGDKKQARQWYDKAVPWMDKNRPQDDELRRFRAEAADLLGVKYSQSRNGKEVSPR